MNRINMDGAKPLSVNFSGPKRQAPPQSVGAADLAGIIRDAVGDALNGPVRSVSAGRSVQLSVRESGPYRFDGARTEEGYDFSTDLINYLRGGDGDAGTRIFGFMSERLGPQFVSTSDVAAVNPDGYRPEWFVPQQKYATPLRDAFYKGTLESVTPFKFPKFSQATNLVTDHVEGTEPTAGTFTLSDGTVSPSPVSGKIHIDREVWDQGGNPQVSGLIWGQMQYEYLKVMELKVAAMLEASASSLSELVRTPLTAGANTIETLADPIEAGIATLNYTAGGPRFDYAAAHIDLYLALAGLRDPDGRPYYPMINPANSNGGGKTGYRSLVVAGAELQPVWSLGTTSDGTAHRSYLADKSSVFFWHSSPTQLSPLGETVEGFDMGIWGYQAGVVADPTGLLKLTYTPAAD